MESCRRAGTVARLRHKQGQAENDAAKSDYDTETETPAGATFLEAGE